MSLSTGSGDHVHESTVVLNSLLATSGHALLLLLLLNLGGLVLHLTGTGQRTVHLSATTQAKHQVKGRLLLDIIIAQSAAILKLLSRKDQTLLIRRNALLVLNLGLDIVNAIRRLHLEGDGLTRQSLDEDLNYDKMEKVVSRANVRVEENVRAGHYQ